MTRQQRRQHRRQVNKRIGRPGPNVLDCEWYDGNLVFTGDNRAVRRATASAKRRTAK